MEEKKRKARERAMKAMKLSATKFSAHLMGEEKEKEKEKEMELDRRDGEELRSAVSKQGDGGGIGDGDGGSFMRGNGLDDNTDSDTDESDRETTLCIVCQSNGEEKECANRQQMNSTTTIGLLAFSQLSCPQPRCVNGVRPSATMWLAPEIEVEREGCGKDCKREDGEVHLSFCGHG